VVLTTATTPYLEHMSTCVEHFLEHHAVALDEMVMKYGEPPRWCRNAWMPTPHPRTTSWS
jgi:hypothetical protein